MNAQIRATPDAFSAVVDSRSRCARPIATLLVILLLALQPLAQATPPDPTWISGLWDDSDYDDVVLVITGAVVAAESFFADPLGPIASRLSPVVSRSGEIVAAHPLESRSSRAPPQPLS